MALAITELTRGWDSTDVTGPSAYTIPSTTPGSGSGVIVLYCSREATTAPTLTPTNTFGGTWVQLGGAAQIDGISGIGGWYIPSANGSASTISMAVPAAVVNIGMAYSVLEVTGHNAAGLVVTVVYGPTGTTSATLGLAASAPALADANNGQIFWGGCRANQAITAEAGWTAGTGANGTNPNFGSKVEWKIAGFDSSPTMTQTSARWQSMYIEVAIAPAGGGGYTGLWVPAMRRNHLGSMQAFGRA